MEELEVYGHYYKLFKGDGGIPREVTVIALDGDMVTVINGHHKKEELGDCTTFAKMRCNKNAIITNITEKQKKQINKENARLQKMTEKADRSLEAFKNGEI